MKTSVLVVDPAQPSREAIRQAAAVLHRGGLVSFPTETVYGLGASALDAAAVQRIFEAKGRPAHNPIIVHVAGVVGVSAVAASWPAAAAALAQRFWPGPLTLVLPRRSEVPDVVTASGPTVAVRVPAHPVARALLEEAAIPVAAPSANRSAGLSPTRAEHVLHDLDGRIDLVLDGGPCPGGIESTVIDVTTVPPRLLRPGLVSRGELEAVVGLVVVGAPPAAGPLPSPGLLTRHYAPRTPLECIPAVSWESALALCREGRKVGWVIRGASMDVPAGVVVRNLPADPAGYAAGLYAVLHDLDAAGLDRIILELPPDEPEWVAVRDRLCRAAASSSTP
jgi:L-threonylcarbamoyladenylate synthase